MAFTEIELKRCEKALAQFLERRRPPITFKFFGKDATEVDYEDDH